MLVFAVHAIQFVLEVILRPETDWKANVMTINGMATELVPLGLCFLPAYLLGGNEGCGKMGLGSQLFVLGVALLSVLQQILSLAWEQAPQLLEYVAMALAVGRRVVNGFLLCCERDVIDPSKEGQRVRAEEAAEEGAVAAKTAAEIALTAAAMAMASALEAEDDYDHGHWATSQPGLSSSSYAHSFFRAGTVKNLLNMDGVSIPTVVFGWHQEENAEPNEPNEQPRPPPRPPPLPLQSKACSGKLGTSIVTSILHEEDKEAAAAAAAAAVSPAISASAAVDRSVRWTDNGKQVNLPNKTPLQI
jgi:hypothetical protein